MWNDKFELPDGCYSVSDIQDYIEYIIKKHETFTTIPIIYVYINIINNRLVFKIRFDVVEVVLVQCNLLDNQYHQKPELLYTFKTNKSDVYLLNAEPSN